MTDLTKIQSDLEKLGQIMFGSSSPVQNFFQIKFTPTKTRQRNLSHRVRVDADSLSSNIPKSSAGSHREHLDSESRDSRGGSDDKSGERKKKTRLGDRIRRVSVFRGKSRKKSKGKITFVDETNEDNDDDVIQGMKILTGKSGNTEDCFLCL